MVPARRAASVASRVAASLKARSVPCEGDRRSDPGVPGDGCEPRFVAGARLSPGAGATDGAVAAAPGAEEVAGTCAGTPGAMSKTATTAASHPDIVFFKAILSSC